MKMDPVKIVQRHKESFKMAEVGKAAIWVVHIFLGPKKKGGAAEAQGSELKLGSPRLK